MASFPLKFLEGEIESLKEQGLYFSLHSLDGNQVPRTIVDGRPVINIASNNYLGLATHPKLKQLAINAIQELGVGVAAARIICGNMPIHATLEKKIAEFKGTEASLVFQTGYVTNAGVIPSILTSEDAVVSDELNHASIIDGARMSRANIKVYKHCDPDSAEQQLKQAREEGVKNILLVTDSIFSMDGDIAPLPGLVAAAKKYNAIVMVDDAHAVGVLGKEGQGIVSHFDLKGEVDIQMGTLSKALGVIGGYIAGSQSLIDWLIRRHRPFVFSASTHTPADVAACIGAIEVLQEEPERLERLWQNTHYFKNKLNDLGFNTGRSETPIIPIIVGRSELATEMSRHLLDEGVFATALVFPIVARDMARLRTLMSSEHTKDDLDEVLVALEKVGKLLNII